MQASKCHELHKRLGGLKKKNLRMNEMKKEIEIIRYGNLLEGWIMHQNNAILFTGFNARVFSGKETFLIFFQVQRKQVKTHLQTAVTVHLDLARLRLKESQNVTRQLMVKFSTPQNLFLEKLLKDENKIERENGTFLWKVHNFNEVLKQSKAGYKEKVESGIP